jgi:hypothetical protein
MSLQRASANKRNANKEENTMMHNIFAKNKSQSGYILFIDKGNEKRPPAQQGINTLSWFSGIINKKQKLRQIKKEHLTVVPVG